ncbi:MAG: hypothetical protein U5L04_07010 [Trueperaceae bacterium]|nr:hypothetical protein [Trueperaceae bacterium]
MEQTDCGDERRKDDCRDVDRVKLGAVDDVVVELFAADPQLARGLIFGAVFGVCVYRCTTVVLLIVILLTVIWVVTVVTIFWWLFFDTRQSGFDRKQHHAKPFAVRKVLFERVEDLLGLFDRQKHFDVKTFVDSLFLPECGVHILADKFFKRLAGRVG